MFGVPYFEETIEGTNDLHLISIMHLKIGWLSQLPKCKYLKKQMHLVYLIQLHAHVFPDATVENNGKKHTAFQNMFIVHPLCVKFLIVRNLVSTKAAAERIC